MSLSSIIKKLVGDFRHNKAAAFTHGLGVTTQALTAVVICLGVLAAFNIVQPVELLQAVGYTLILYIADYRMVRILAWVFRFSHPNLFGVITLSSLVTGITAIGAVSITWRWHRA